MSMDLATKSKAPSFVASTASFTVPLAVTRITSKLGEVCLTRASTSKPVRFGMTRSSTRISGSKVRSSPSASSPELAV